MNIGVATNFTMAHFFGINIWWCRSHTPSSERPAPSMAAIPSPTLFMICVIIDTSHIYEYTHTNIHSHTHTGIQESFIHMLECVHKFIHPQMCVCAFACVYTRTHAHTHAYVYIYTYWYIFKVNMEHFVNLRTTIPTLLFIARNLMRVLRLSNEEHKEEMEFLLTL